MSDVNAGEPTLLIIRRGGSGELETPKGGVWKIAYADFMTAMMAFFLVMWLINATSETTKTSIANYFNPIKLSDGSLLPKKGLRDPDEEDLNPGGPAATETTEPENGSGAGAGKDPQSASGRSARFTEEALFRDPYAVLAAIAAEADGTTSLIDQNGGTDAEDGGAPTYGDPFDPAAWNVDRRPAETAPQPPAGPAAGAASPQVETLSAGSEQSAQDAVTELLAAAGAPVEVVTEGEEDAAELTAADEAASEATGDAERGPESGPESDAAGDAAAGAGVSPLERELVEALGSAAQRMPNVTVESAEGGVLISLADQVEFGMFAIGSAEPLPETIAVMEKIAALLEKTPGKVIIRGHTDGRPFRSDDYDNWRLSSARAHMAFHMLVRGGLDEARVERIEGYADRDLKLPDSPEAAGNRRIDILVQEVSS